MVDLPLNENATIQLNAFGDATVGLGPRAHGLTWHVQLASVRVQGPVTNEATCALFVGNQPTQDNFCDNTRSGSTGDSSGHVAGDIRVGSFVWAQWVHGDPGAQATLVVSGTQTLEQ